MSELRSQHQMFLQGVMSRGILSDKEMKDLLKRCCDFSRVQTSTVEQAVSTINKQIKPIYLEIKKGLDEDNGECYWVFANTVENKISLLSTNYTVNELELFKKILEKLVQNHSGVISSTRVLNLVDEMEKKVMSKKDAQDLLERFVNEKWLIESGDGEISLSIRTILELEHYFKEVFPDDINTCTMCKQIVFKGQCCDHCNLKIHNHCANRYFRNRQKNECPQCLKDWPN